MEAGNGDAARDATEIVNPLTATLAVDILTTNTCQLKSTQLFYMRSGKFEWKET